MSVSQAVARRRRIGLVAAVALAVALLAAGVARIAGGGPPADEAVRLVPATALVYAHLSTDPGRDEDTRVLERLAGFPAVASAVERISRTVGSGFDPARDVRPWLGDEAAFALLDTRGSRADSLLLLSVRDRPKAEAFLRRAQGSRGTTTHRGVPIQRYPGVSVAFVDGFMAVGQDTAVRAAIDRSQGQGAAFAASVAYRRVADERPEERALDVVIPAEGVRRVLVPAPGALGVAGAVLEHPKLVAVSASLSERDEGLRLDVRQARSAAGGDEFEPAFAEETPEEAAAYLGFAGIDALGALVPAGARDALGSVLADALDSASLDPETDLLAPLDGEVALSLTPGLGAPTLTLIAETSDEARTREALARLQQPVAERLGRPVAPGAPAASFEQRELGDVTAFALDVTPGFELTYAVAGGRLVVSTQSNGVGHVLAERPGLPGTEAFDRAIGDLPDRLEAVVFMDLGKLLALADQAGSTGDPSLDSLRDDLRRLRTVGAVVRREETDSTAELFFEIP